MFPHKNNIKTKTIPAKELSEELPDIAGQRAICDHVRR
jgi:ppGpp synthetase/RelA/SpoT-type nucleotidyltranferase